MKIKLVFLSGLSGSLLLLGACTSIPAPATNTATTTTSPSSANKAAKAAPKGATTEPSNAANKKGVPNAVTVPTDWDYYADAQTGYEFKMPKDAKSADVSEAGVDAYAYQSGDVEAVIVIYNNKKLTKDDLFRDAADFASGASYTNFTLTNKKELNDDYSTADYTVNDKDGKKHQGKLLVATDVSDNYLFFVDTPADKFAANSKTIDEILGSFAMYSGGASGDSTKSTGETKNESK